MIALQMFVGLRPSASNFIVKRNKVTKADHIKLINSATKALFGGVIKTKPSKAKRTSSSKLNDPTVSSDVASSKRTESDYSSEMYWILGNSKKSAPRISDGNGNSAKDNKSERFVNTKVEHTNSGNKPIPFSTEELNNVLIQPLQCNVLPKHPVDLELLKIPSVSRVLQYTMSDAARAALLNWKTTKISELGEQGFADLQQGECMEVDASSVVF